MSRRTILPFALVLSAASLLYAQVNAPKIGVARYPDGRVHAIYGFTENVLVGEQLLASADAVSFSDGGGLVAKNGQISLLGPDFSTIAQYDSGESAPVLNVDGDLNSAVAWLPSSGSILHWNGTSFIATAVPDHASLGRATSVRMLNRRHAELLVDNGDGTVSQAVVSLHSGDLTSVNLLPGVQAPAFRDRTLVLFPDPQGLELSSATGILATLPLNATDLVFERMASGWLHISSASTSRNWILHLNGTAAELSELPPPVTAQPNAVTKESGK